MYDILIPLLFILFDSMNLNIFVLDMINTN